MTPRIWCRRPFSARGKAGHVPGTRIVPAAYIRRPDDPHHVALALDVLRIENGTIAEVTTFELKDLVDAFGILKVLS
jgi:hypothetical protein